MPAKHDLNWFKDKIKQIYSDNIIVNEYFGYNKLVNINCKFHGSFEDYPYNVIKNKNHGCPKCSKELQLKYFI